MLPSTNIKTARYIVVTPNKLKEIAVKMELEHEVVRNLGHKIVFQLTEDIVLYYDPEVEA